MGKLSQDQINVDLFDEVMRLKRKLKSLKEGIGEVKKFIEEHTGTVDRPRTLSIDETYDVYEKLTRLHRE